MHKRTQIRNTLKTLLEAALPVGVEVTCNRAHKISTFPTVGILSMDDIVDIEEYTSTTTPHRYNVSLEIYVSSIDHDADTDALIEVVEQVISSNRKNEFWSYAIVLEYSTPEIDGGNKTYSLTSATIQFHYEVSS